MNLSTCAFIADAESVGFAIGKSEDGLVELSLNSVTIHLVKASESATYPYHIRVKQEADTKNFEIVCSLQSTQQLDAVSKAVVSWAAELSKPNSGYTAVSKIFDAINKSMCVCQLPRP